MIGHGLLAFTLLLFPLGQLGRMSYLAPSINVYLYELPMGVFVAYCLARYGLSPFKKIFPHFRITAFFFLWMALVFLLTASSFSPLPNLVAFLYIARLVTYFLFATSLSYFVGRTKKILPRLEKIFRWVAVVIILSSIVQYFWYWDLRNLAYLGWDEHVSRVVGTFLDTAVAAAIYGLLIVFYAGRSLKKVREKVLLIALTTLSILTYSRGFYLAAVAVVLYLGIRTKKILLLGATLLLITVTFFALNSSRSEGTNLLRTTSIAAREREYQEAIALWKKHPFLGVGYNRIQYYKKKPDTRSVLLGWPQHGQSSFSSSFLTILVTLGIVGLLGFLGMLWEMSNATGRGELYIIFLSVVSLFDNVFLHPFILLMLAVILTLEKNKVSTPSRT